MLEMAAVPCCSVVCFRAQLVTIVCWDTCAKFCCLFTHPPSRGCRWWTTDRWHQALPYALWKWWEWLPRLWVVADEKLRRGTSKLNWLGGGTDDNALIGVMVSCSEMDVLDGRRGFLAKYGIISVPSRRFLMLKKREVFWQQILDEEREEGFWHEKPHDLPLPPGLSLHSTCLLPKPGSNAVPDFCQQHAPFIFLALRNTRLTTEISLELH